MWTSFSDRRSACHECPRTARCPPAVRQQKSKSRRLARQAVSWITAGCWRKLSLACSGERAYRVSGCREARGCGRAGFTKLERLGRIPWSCGRAGDIRRTWSVNPLAPGIAPSPTQPHRRNGLLRNARRLQIRCVLGPTGTLRQFQRTCGREKTPSARNARLPDSQSAVSLHSR
jgi:hypothetical protein